MVASFPSNADSAQLATDGYSEVILLTGGGGGGGGSATTDFLLIGGGGGAGGRHAGGGGAGGYKTSWAGAGSELSGGTPGTLKTALTLNSGTAYSITVGQGGRFGFDGYRGVSGVTKGNDTSISGSDITTVSVDGGGFGAGGNDETNTAADAQGGSSGGASYGGSATAHSLTDEGHAGGASGASAAPYVGGGGGGAGGVGQTGYNAGSGTIVGGLPRTSSITGASVARAGGGGGGQYQAGGTWSGLGGGGGAGNGTYASGNGTYAGDALAHTGSGGGGGGGDYSAGGNGASGISIFRIPSTVTYSASQLSDDTSSLSNLTATYLNTQVYTDDTNFGSVVLLLDGSSTTDLSSASPTVTPSASGLTSGNSGGKYGQYIDFQNSGYINVALPSALGVSTEAFTVECWAYFDSTSNGGVFQLLRSGSTLDGSIDNNTVSLAVAAYNNAWQVYDDTGGNAVGSVSTGAWYHVALVYDGTDLVFYVDGSALLTKSNWTANLSATGYPNIAIGGYYSTSFVMDGRIEDFRVTEGVARYTSSFTPPIAALPNRETSTGGDHVITFTIADASGGNISSGSGTSATNRGSSDGTATWTPTLSTTTVPSTTWTIPAGVDSVSIVAIGPGGGAGGSNGTNAGGGGGGGGLAWINGVSVNKNSTITLTGGVGGTGADSGGSGGDSGSAAVVAISYAGPADYSAVNLNPFNDVIISSDSAAGILYARSETDSAITSSFGQLDSAPQTGISDRLRFDIYDNFVNTITLDSDINANTRTKYSATDLPLSYPSWSGGAAGGMNDSDAYPNLYIDSNLYENEDTVLGKLDSAPEQGAGRLLLFGIFENQVGTALQATISNSPYLDSNGNSTIGPTDPNDVRGYGPTGDQGSVEVIVRSRAGDTISSV